MNLPINLAALAILTLAMLIQFNVVNWPMPRTECEGPWTVVADGRQLPPTGPTVCRKVWP